MTAGEAIGGELAGKVLGGRYRVTATIGRGGMGVVARAVDELLDREVAVKVMRAYTDASETELAALRSRMRREAQAAARIRHPGVVTVHDVTAQDGLPVIVMELVDGPSLDDVLASHGPLDPREAAAIGARLMDALDAAHRAGVLHRDVKPANVLLEQGGRVVLTDFGIATVEDSGDEAAAKLTRSGEIVGSLDFLAPERAQGREPGPASDIWSLGMTLYQAVEGGASPFRRTAAWSTLAAIVGEPLPEPRRAGPLAPVLRALLAKDPEDRPAAGQARELLERVAAGGLATPATMPAPAHPGTPAPASAGTPAPAQTSTFAPAGTFAPASTPAPAQASTPAPAGTFAPVGTFALVGTPAPGTTPAPATMLAPVPPPPPPSTGAAAPPPSGYGRGARAAVAAAVAVLLAGGGIAYALMTKDGRARGSGGAQAAPPAATPKPKAKPTPGGRTTAPAAPDPAPTSTPTTCTGWGHQDRKPGSYAFMAGDFPIVTGPYQTCATVAMAKTGTKLLFHCSVVNAHGNRWTYVSVADTDIAGWMSNDRLTRQKGPATTCQ
ncbi:protein kinase [Streptomyces sp. NPDC090022]|uniref:serine/threonine-protein kinase n=1 Tax=Streptomyces sp. NPDC090022 TaxID=3365920 RepID=UPI00382BB824